MFAARVPNFCSVVDERDDAPSLSRDGLQATSDDGFRRRSLLKSRVPHHTMARRDSSGPVHLLAVVYSGVCRSVTL